MVTLLSSSHGGELAANLLIAAHNRGAQKHGDRIILQDERARDGCAAVRRQGRLARRAGDPDR
jgi:hypothetical protein